MKIIATNKSASFEYFIEEKYEAGIVLEGNEIKSLRAGNVNMNDCFCFVRGSEVSVKNMHIALYDKSDGFSTRDTRRDRKLLLHKGEIAKIAGKINRQGYTLVPLKLYFKDALVKVEIALCKGKHTYDKKQSIAERDIKRSTDRDIKNAGF
ncbi:MAG: SsrA-binding protein SmpB [Clostridia bacterium]|nr:SsrA-binding protein SmpB [Clostridia bacterium]